MIYSLKRVTWFSESQLIICYPLSRGIYSNLLKLRFTKPGFLSSLMSLLFSFLDRFYCISFNTPMTCEQCIFENIWFNWSTFKSRWTCASSNFQTWQNCNAIDENGKARAASLSELWVPVEYVMAEFTSSL